MEKEEVLNEEVHECKCANNENIENNEHVCHCGGNCQCNADDDDNFDESEEVLILKNNIQNLEEKLKASHAELINYRKRKDEEVANKLKFANQDLILDILPVLDNFERAIKLQKTDDTNLTKFLDGFKMLYTSLNETLKRYGVEEIECLGKEFSVYIVNNYNNGLSRTKKLAVRLLGGGGSGTGGTTYSNSEIVSMIDEAKKEAIASANDYTDDEIVTVTEFEEEAVDFSNWQ